MLKILAGNYAMMKTIAVSQTARISSSTAIKARGSRGKDMSASFWYGSLYLLTFVKTSWLGGGYIISMHHKKGARLFQVVFEGFISESNMPSKLEDDIQECLEYLGLVDEKKKSGVVQKTIKKAKDMLTGKGIS